MCLASQEISPSAVQAGPPENPRTLGANDLLWRAEPLFFATLMISNAIGKVRKAPYARNSLGVLHPLISDPTADVICDGMKLTGDYRIKTSAIARRD